MDHTSAGQIPRRTNTALREANKTCEKAKQKLEKEQTGSKALNGGSDAQDSNQSKHNGE